MTKWTTEYRKEYDRKRHQANREKITAQKKARRHSIRKWMIEYKKTLECSQCGEDDFRVLDFHHDGKGKEINVSDAVKRGWSIDRIKAEIDKCIILCCKCHRILHYNEGNNGV